MSYLTLIESRFASDQVGKKATREDKCVIALILTICASEKLLLGLQYAQHEAEQESPYERVV